MTSKIIGIQGDKLDNINISSDTSIFLAFEAQNLGYKIFYYTPSNLSIIKNKILASGVFLKLNYKNKKFYKIYKKQTMDVDNLKFILIRQDPPFNSEYLITTLILDNLKKTKVINNPTAIRNVSEKLYSKNFIKYMPNTIFTSDMDKIIKFYKNNKQMIMKPINGYGGNQIHLFKNKFNKKFISNYLKKNGHSMFQKFLKKISKGDKRVFIINGKVCGAISRVPKKGSYLSNMSKGAVPKLTKLTKKEIKISKIIGKRLKKDNIYFAGIDFIDQKLNGDINVTSPTGLKTYFDLSKINLAKTFWKGLKA
tara:strand:- start:7061 stop:7987 length:927 start_codon:yes stop_codon:yes gene_type:complete